MTDAQEPRLTDEELAYFLTLLRQDDPPPARTAPTPRPRRLSRSWWAAAVFLVGIIAVSLWVLLADRSTG